ncbi:MAG: transposase, partial [Rubrobacter sp.]
LALAPPDLVERDFAREAPEELWVADISSYVPSREGFVYLAVVLDAYSRRVVGWSMASHLRAELVMEALEMALWRRDPAPGVIHHSDRGSQYTSVEFGQKLRGSGLVASMGSTADCFDNPHSAVSDRDIVEFLVSGTQQAEYLLVYRPEVKYVPTYFPGL